MQFLNLKDIDENKINHTFKESSLPSFIFSLIFLGLCIFWGCITYNSGNFFNFSFSLDFESLFSLVFKLIGGFVIFIMALVSPLIFLITFNSFLATTKKTNWIIKVSDDGLYIKYRSYMNSHFSDSTPEAIFIPAPEIKSVYDVYSINILPGSEGGSEKHKNIYLDILLNNNKTSELKEALNKERNGMFAQKGFINSKSKHYPVNIPEPGIIRIDWKTSKSNIIPGIKKTLNILGYHYFIDSMLKLETKSWNKAEEKELDDLILELCQSGDDINAVKVIKQRYGYNTTMAVKFLDEMKDSMNK